MGRRAPCLQLRSSPERQPEGGLQAGAPLCHSPSSGHRSCGTQRRLPQALPSSLRLSFLSLSSSRDANCSVNSPFLPLRLRGTARPRRAAPGTRAGCRTSGCHVSATRSSAPARTGHGRGLRVSGADAAQWESRGGARGPGGGAAVKGRAASPAVVSELSHPGVRLVAATPARARPRFRSSLARPTARPSPPRPAPCAVRAAMGACGGRGARAVKAGVDLRESTSGLGAGVLRRGVACGEGVLRRASVPRRAGIRCLGKKGVCGAGSPRWGFLG